MIGVDGRPRAVVTGGMGFLGRHFVARLAARGYVVDVVDVAVHDRRPEDVPIDRPNVRYARMLGDCRHWFERRSEPSSVNRYDLAIHCAALVGGRARIDGTPLDLSVNLDLDSAYARWLVAARPQHAVYVSSSAVYPVALQDDARGDARLVEYVQLPTSRTGMRLGAPDQVYGWTKLVGEALMDRVCQAGVPVTIVRPFSGYGSDQDLSYPFPAFADRATRRLDPFDVWGDGRQVRDFVHVDDVVDATLALVRSVVVNEPVNICTGDGTAFGDLAGMFASAAGYEPKLRFHPDAPTGVRHRVGDPTLLNRYYRPTVSLADGVSAALWHRKSLIDQEANRG